MQIDGIFPNFDPNKTSGIEGRKNTPTTDFKDMLSKAIQDVNRMQNDSDTKVQSLMTGESKDIHATVLAVQQADTSFKLMMQVRNKIIEAYKEISRSGM